MTAVRYVRDALVAAGVGRRANADLLSSRFAKSDVMAYLEAVRHVCRTRLSAARLIV